MNNPMKRYVPLVDNKGELNQSNSFGTYYNFQIADYKIVVQLISDYSQAKLKTNNGFYTGSNVKSNRDIKYKVISNFTINVVQRITQNITRSMISRTYQH